ncbi:MAG: MarR family transcriptional regulator [Labilithrix sp.]|nr:MarR family transcriptional regulator [Labilithrix sp.]
MATTRAHRARRKAVDDVGRDTALRHFIEEMGLQFEMSGVPRMAGRILGHLLVCDPPEQTAEELARSIQASRASISTMIRLLIHAGFVAREVKPGRRRDVFRIHPEAFRMQLMGRIRLLGLFREALGRGLAALEGEPPERTARVRAMFEMYQWMERELPLLLERYQREMLDSSRKRGRRS